jgi:hypothetical protein
MAGFHWATGGSALGPWGLQFAWWLGPSEWRSFCWFGWSGGSGGVHVGSGL